VIEVKTIVDRAHRYLRNQILSGELKPGDRIVQATVAEKLGISRIPVRESIHALVSEGLAEVEPHHGAVVAPISIDHAREVFGVRALLEEHLLRLSFKSGKIGSCINLTQKYLTKMKVKRRRIADFEEWSDCHWNFHKSLYDPANQPHTMALVKNLFAHSERYIALEISDNQSSDVDQKDHEQLLEFITSENEEEAIRILRYHILKTPEILEDTMRRGQTASITGG
jgi:DNA-binding GntR family transcriptional regulator